MHIQSLAKSMGFLNVVECNITGVKCNSMSIEMNNQDLQNACNMITENSGNNLTEKHVDDCENEVLFLQSEMGRFRFCPITESIKKELCSVLAIPYTQNSRNCEKIIRILGKPCVSKQIIGYGNWFFFRAISYSLTNTENYYYEVRSAVCKHLLENKNDFAPFSRSNDVSVESHVSSIWQDENWVTELEILALAHMLSVDIFTYSERRWIQFSGLSVCSSMQSKAGGLYLNHRNVNHYDVVLDVAEPLADEENNLIKESDGSNCDKKKACANKRTNILQYKREMYRKKYKNNPEFRNEKLDRASLKYKSDIQFRDSLRVNDRVRYQTDATYRDLKKFKGRAMYKDLANKDSLLRQAKRKVSK